MNLGKFNLDYDEVLEHATHLVENVRDRFAGTEEANVAAQYIEEVLDSYGVPCAVASARLYVSVPEESSIEVLGEDEISVNSVPFANTATTAAGGLVAEVLFLGAGSEADFEARDVRGKIVLVESSYSPPRQEKIRLAGVHGAVGIIIMHWGDSDSDLMVRGNAKAVWGNPEVDDIERLPKIPAVGVSRRDGTRLADLASQGELKCRLKTAAKQFWTDVPLPLVKITGTEKPDELVIVGGHYDAWSGGATDNAVGVGFMLELARALHRSNEGLHRSVWIAFWPGHESTTMSGSTWFVDHYWDELSRGGAVYINVDTLGLQDSEQMFIHGSVELQDFAANVSKQTLGEEPRLFPLARTGDQSFFGVGIPSLYGRTGYSEDVLKRTHNATLGWWNHSHPSQDEMDKVDPRLVRKAGNVIENWIHAYVTDAGLPGNYRNLLQAIRARLNELQSQAPNQLRLGAVADMATELDAALQRFQSTSGKQSAAVGNQLQLRLSRVLTPVFASVAGKYGQDPYGLSALKTRLPGLYWLESSRSGMDEGAVHTTLIRQRNRIADALAQGIVEVHVALDSLRV